MESKPIISFEDTAVAFSYKSDAALKKAHFLFLLVNHPWISSLATNAVRLGLKLNLPIEGIIRKTAFDHFCGGESIEKSEDAVQKLASFGVGTILDYSVEGEDSETDFNRTMEEILHTIDKAKDTRHIPFSVFKVTGIGSIHILEKVQHKDRLSAEELQSWENIKKRVDKICESAHVNNVSVLIDAEESWIQEPIDMLAYEMMQKYNQQRTIVFNTYQLYRTDSLANLQVALTKANAGNYYIGAKIVRGAYMEKERDRASKERHVSPIHPTKEATDKAFNDALTFCIENLDRMSVMCGSHNEYSNLYLTTLLQKNNLAPNHPNVWFAQLYGMSDNISFNLAKAGYNVVKYVPYGPIKSVMPYLFRRADENTSVAGQSSRELLLIRKELHRRKLNIKS
jgi:proline dehydrogenase